MPHSPFENVPSIATMLPLNIGAAAKLGLSAEQGFDSLLQRAGQPHRNIDTELRNNDAPRTADYPADQVHNEIQTELQTRARAANRETPTAKRRIQNAEAQPANRPSNLAVSKKERRASKAADEASGSNYQPQSVRDKSKAIDEKQSDDETQTPTVCDVHCAATSSAEPCAAEAAGTDIAAKSAENTTAVERFKPDDISTEFTTTQVAAASDELPAASRGSDQIVVQGVNEVLATTIQETTQLLPTTEINAAEIVAAATAGGADAAVKQHNTVEVSAGTESAASNAETLASESLEATGIENVVVTSQPVQAENSMSAPPDESGTSAEQSKETSSQELGESDGGSQSQFNSNSANLQVSAVATSLSSGAALSTNEALEPRESATSKKEDAAQPVAAANRTASLNRGEQGTSSSEVAINTPSQVSANGRKESHATARITPAGTNTVDPSRFIQRVARAFRAADEQGGQLRLRLNPPELGAVRVEVAVRDGVMTAHLEAETSQARSLLLEHLPALRERLAEQQIKIERFDVDLRQDLNNGGSPNPSPNFGEQRNANRSPQMLGKANASGTQGPALATTGPVAPAVDGRINVII